MNYIKNKFHIEKNSTINLAKTFGTPLYCYSHEKLRKNVEKFKKVFEPISPLICFSVKSNSNLKLLKEIKKMGLGADVVSKGELIASLKAGINKKMIVFSGVGKTTSELKFAIKKGILLINAESMNEIRLIEKIAKKQKKIVNIGLRLNPNTDAKTIKQISTGKIDDKFGVDSKTFIKIMNSMKNSKYINVKCLSVHIGSQILDYKPYLKMLKTLEKIIRKTNYNFEYVDLGGGMGIKYDNNNRSLNYSIYKKEIIKFKNRNNCKIIFEPGRSIIGNTAVLISKIIYLKENKNKIFAILDAAMNDLIRPALYKAKHRIVPALRRSGKFRKSLEFVGPICESTDKFLTEKKFNKLKEEDYVIICDTGAYGFSLSSNYNLRVKPAEILIKGKNISIIRKRQSIQDII